MTPRSSDRGWFGVVVIVQLLAVGAMAWLTPPGEAPDEPAHLWYAAWLGEHGTPPPLSPGASTTGYEAYQPPLGYLPAALVAAAVDLRISSEPEWPRNPEFSFDRPTRAFTVGPGSAPMAPFPGLFSVRLAGLGWLAVTTWCGFVAVGRSFVRADVLCVFLLAPQLIFMHAVVTNDSSVVAASTAALLLLFVSCRQDDRRQRVAFAAGVVSGLAAWCKSSAFFLLLPAAAALLGRWRRGDRRPGVAFAAGWVLSSVGWATIHLARFGTLSPNPPFATGFRWEAVLEVLQLWTWVPSLAMSFWGKLGWLNVPLPLWSYAWFALPSALVGFGLLTVFGGRSRHRTRLVAAVAVIANVGLLVVYLVSIDWQPQGRYVWPSWLGMAVLASDAVDRRWPGRDFRALALLVSGLFLVVAVATLAIGYDVVMF